VLESGGKSLWDGESEIFLRRALEDARMTMAENEATGVEFIAENGGGPGVRLRK